MVNAPAHISYEKSMNGNLSNASRPSEEPDIKVQAMGVMEIQAQITRRHTHMIRE